jgi:competence protein ComEC
MLIQTPTGRAVLINGGPSPSGLADALGRRISTFDRSLDWLVVASPQEQQLAALPDLLDRFPVGNVLWSGNPDASRSARDLDRSLAARNIAITRLYPGAILDLGSGARLEALAVSARGAVLLLEWNGFRALLPVGMDLAALEELDFGKRIGQVSVLLLADSGYAPLNPPKWLASLQPQLTVLTVSAGDPSGLPDQSVLDSLSGRTLLRTDHSGWIEISTDGLEMTIEVERQ